MIHFRIDVFSHNVRVSGFSYEGYRALREYCRTELTLFGLVPVGYNKVKRAPILERRPQRVFATSNQDRKEFRFHINCLEPLTRFLIGSGFEERQIEKVYHTVPEGASCVFKFDPTWVPREKQVPAIEYLLSPGKSKLVILQTGGGKAQPFDAKVKIPGGWKQMGDIVIGDVVTAKDGTPTLVNGVFPQGRKEIFKVTFADGRSTECCEDHLWKVYRPNRSWDSKVVDTREMIRLKQLSNDRLYIDLPEPELSQDVDLPIDPYVLGVIIGNGCIRDNGLLISSGDPETLAEFQRLLPTPMALNYVAGYDYRVICPGMKNNILLDSLRQLGLGNKRSHEKFIPEIYMSASTTQRLSLLQGLMDTDGTASTTGSPSYSTSSPKLAKDVQSIVRSLGGHALMRFKKPHYTYNGEYKQGLDSFTIGIRIKNPASLFRLQRKRERVNYDNQYSETLKLGVSSIESVAFKHAFCISIDHPEKLYVTDEYVVTHNTSLTLKAISMDGKRTAIVIKGMYVERWIDDIKQKLGLKPGELLVVRGSKDLTALIRMGLSGELKAKMIIITNRTLQIYFDTVEQFNGDYSLYGCHPSDFYEVIGCGRRIIDEIHQDFHLNFKQDLYTNIERTIALTATFTADNHFINKMYDTAYPTLMRYTSEVYSQYIEVRCLIYGLQHPSPLRFLSRMKTYSHVEFEKSLMRQREMTRRYTDMISTVVDTSFVRVRKPGQKMLIFCGTIKYCTHLQEHLQKLYPHLKVGRYVEEDKYEDLLSSDICVSTILSAGTAVDIPGLRITLMTNALSSSQANEQALGRLRELPGEVCEFLYFCCEDIPKHKEYSAKKYQVFAGKVKAHHDLYLNVRI